MSVLSIHSLAILLVAGLPLAAAAQSSMPPSTRTVQHLSVAQVHALTGKRPNQFPETYSALGATVAYRNRWRSADADYDTDVTVGLRFGLGRSVRSGYQPNNREVSQGLRGVNVFVASDGRYVGASLGGWFGRMGTFRSASFVPQVRIRVGTTDGWHGQMDYADELLGLGNPPLRLGGGLRFPQSPLTLLLGAAIPTDAPEGSEVQAFTRLGLRLGKSFQAGVYFQPRFTKVAPTQASLTIGYEP